MVDDELLDLGEGVTAGHLDGGLILQHVCVDGVVASAPIMPESHQATFHQDLLTIRPTVHCDACGLNGQVTDGVWEPVEP